jgi:hypothetical protein
MPSITSICVYCGSSLGNKPNYAEAAHELGKLLAQRQITLIYGGGNVGLMGVLADACLDAGGHVIGVIPDGLLKREVAHRYLTHLHVVKDMHERKALMMRLADAFIALPGGYGTYDEYFEALTWAQLGYHSKPCGLLNIAGFYDSFLRYIDHVVREGFVRSSDRSLIIDDPDAVSLLDRLTLPQSQIAPKWGKQTTK